MSDLVDVIRGVVRQELERTQGVAVGRVTALHLGSGAYACDVLLLRSETTLQQVPIATSCIGAAAPPVVGELVLLAFEQGDLQHPLVIGRLYGSEQPAATDLAEGRVQLALPFASAEGAVEPADQITALVTTDTPSVALALGEAITLSADTEQLTLTVGEKLTLRLDVASGDLSLETEGQLELSAADVTISPRGKLEAKADGAVSLQAGADCELKGSAGLTLDGGPQAQLKGGMISIKGMTQFSS